VVNSRAKGAKGEREFAHWLSANGFPASRGVQYHGSPDSPDVICTSLPIHFEVKRTEAFTPYADLAQATKECGLKMPVVAHRKNHGEWTMLLRGSDFIALLQKSAQQKSESG
jgi:Holliday junction resolvase